MNNGPELWKKYLSIFPTDTIVAGGAVRDWMLSGGPPKDIDIFYQLS